MKFWQKCFQPVGCEGRVGSGGETVYAGAKGGLIAFPKKVLATDATYVNFSLQSGFGVQARLTSRLGLRLGLWNDFHFSNAFMVPVNPGIDMMNANLGLSFHFGQ